MESVKFPGREALAESEQAVIGSMLIDPAVVGLVVNELTERDFIWEINRQIFRAYRTLYLEGRTMDLVTALALAAPEDGEVRGYAFNLMDITPTAANIEAYIQQTKRNTLKLGLRELGRRLSEISEPEDAVSLLREGEDRLSQTGKDDEADMAGCALEFTEKLSSVPERLTWGFPKLDEMLFLGPGSFVVLGGRPSDGKTSLALHMAYAQTEKKRVGFFSLETGRNVLFTRLISSRSKVPVKRIWQRALSDADYKRFELAIDQIRKRDLSIIDASAWTAEQIEARTLARKFDVIYVDYLQKIVPGARGRSTRNDEVADISRRLADLARRHGITVVALSQLSRPQNGQRREPVMSDLRESGQIEQDADAILFIWRQQETSSAAPRTLTLAKNKEGMLGTWGLKFTGEIHRFEPDLTDSSPTPADRPNSRRSAPEPEYQQQAFYPLPGSEPVPWEGEQSPAGEKPKT